jgi:two-component system KDP operon response regulator KdpE
MRSKESIPAPTDWQRKGAVDRDAIGVDDGDVAATGTAALDLSERHPDLIVVDLGIPDMDGIDLITRLRASLTAPILVASDRDARTAKVAALGAGADDYIDKPFGADQLMSRVRAILRRPEPPNGEPLRFSA